MKRVKGSPFGHRLREVFRGFQNKDIAYRLGVSNAAVTAYLNGRIPPPNTLIKISHLTGCSIHWLVTGEGPKEVRTENDFKGLRAQTIALANVKGGEAKSTSAAVLAFQFAKRGHQTLLVDTPDGSCAAVLFPTLMRRFRFKRPTLPHGYFPLTLEGRIFFHTGLRELDLCSSNARTHEILSSAGVERFTPKLSNINMDYSYVVLDTGTSGRIFDSIEVLIASLMTSVHVLIPTSGDYLELFSLKQTLELLSKARKTIKDINLLGAFLARYQLGKSNLANVRRELDKMLNGKVLSVVVNQDKNWSGFRWNTARRLMLPRSRCAGEYSALADEILFLLGK